MLWKKITWNSISLSVLEATKPHTNIGDFFFPEGKKKERNLDISWKTLKLKIIIIGLNCLRLSWETQAGTAAPDTASLPHTGTLVLPPPVTTYGFLRLEGAHIHQGCWSPQSWEPELHATGNLPNLTTYICSRSSCLHAPQLVHIIKYIVV